MNETGNDSPQPPANPTHRDLYPEQYTDPLCGLRVTVDGAVDASGHPVEGTVERVVTTWFGRLAVLVEHGPSTAWAADRCRPVDRYTLNGTVVSLDAFMEANEDLEPEEIEAVRNLQPGEEVHFGGGAAARFILRREHPGWSGPSHDPTVNLET